MSIKPLDFQVMIPRSSEVSRIQNDEAAKNQAVHQQQAEANQQKISQNLKQVSKKENIQNGRVDEKQPKDKQNNQPKKKKQQEPDNGHPTIDIKI